MPRPTPSYSELRALQGARKRNYPSRPLPPVIVSIAPTSGDRAGGIPVVIDGSHFRDGVTVTFGGLTADNIVVEGFTRIFCDTPADGAGQVDVVVTTDNGEATLANGYEHTA